LKKTKPCAFPVRRSLAPILSRPSNGHIASAKRTYRTAKRYIAFGEAEYIASAEQLPLVRKNSRWLAPPCHAANGITAFRLLAFSFLTEGEKKKPSKKKRR
jgi:hypothetical protein